MSEIIEAARRWSNKENPEGHPYWLVIPPQGEGQPYLAHPSSCGTPHQDATCIPLAEKCRTWMNGRVGGRVEPAPVPEKNHPFFSDWESEGVGFSGTFVTGFGEPGDSDEESKKEMSGYYSGASCGNGPGRLLALVEKILDKSGLLTDEVLMALKKAMFDSSSESNTLSFSVAEKLQEVVERLD